MTSELSQAERTARERQEPPFTNVSLQRPAYGAGWHDGRTYGRERERALEQALYDLRHFIGVQVSHAGIRPSLGRNLFGIIDTALVAFRGEPKGDTTAEALNRRYAQPDHGPGEPSEGEAKA